MAAGGDLAQYNSDSSSGDEEPCNYTIKLLYDKFHRSELNYRVAACNAIFQEFASSFVGRTFEEFIEDCMSGNVMHKPSVEQIDDELKKICLVHGMHFNPNWLYTHEPHGRRQWVYYAASNCKSINDLPDWYHMPNWHNWNCMRTDTNFIWNTALLNVPDLLDIMLNCRLFDDVRENIDTIVDAYIECDSYGLEFDCLTHPDKLASIMKTFLDNIDDKLLPDKVRYQKQLTNIDGYWDKIPIHSSATTPKCLSDEEENRVLSVVKDLQTPECHNWIKGSLIFKYANEGARYFDLMIFQKFIKDLTNSGSHFEDGENIQKMCEDVCASHKRKKLQLHCYECQSLFDEVTKLHLKSSHLGFHNCKDNPVGGAWGIAKLFMPRNCGLVITPEDSDTQALFQLILNCYLFSKCRVDNIEKIIELRNELMHSPNYTCTGDQFKQLYESVKEFIEEAINQLQKNDQEVRQKLVSSMENIEQIRHSVIEVENIIELGKTAMEYENVELEKQKSREDDEANAQLQERQTRLQKKLQDYKHVEISSLFIEFKNMALFNKDEIKELRRKVHVQEQTNDELREMLNAKEQTNEELRRTLHAQEQTNEEMRGKLHDLEQTNEELGEMLQGEEESSKTLRKMLYAQVEFNNSLREMLHAEMESSRLNNFIFFN